MIESRMYFETMENDRTVLPLSFFDDNTQSATQDFKIEQDGIYFLKFGQKARRSGKAFSYTFWRTQIEDEIFWSVQGVDTCGNKSAWIVTKYFGPTGRGRQFQQEVTLIHPTERKIKITYRATCSDDENRVEMSKCVINQFKNGNNTFDFDFRIVKRKRKPHPVRMMV